MDKKIRLAKYMASSGVASRRKCEELVFEGRVSVNGSVTLLPQTLVNDRDVIKVDSQRVKAHSNKVYYILNKPAGYICSSLATDHRKIVTDLFPKEKTRLFTVGRLDRDTTGLIILTNDGDFANKVIHPSSNIQKEYLAKTGHEISDDHLKKIGAGVYVENVFVKPVKVVKVRKGTLKIVVAEGKKREVRQLVESAGLEVKELKRTRIGGLTLGDIPIGRWRPMSEKERMQIFE